MTQVVKFINNNLGEGEGKEKVPNNKMTSHGYSERYVRHLGASTFNATTK